MRLRKSLSNLEMLKEQIELEKEKKMRLEWYLNEVMNERKGLMELEEKCKKRKDCLGEEETLAKSNSSMLRINLSPSKRQKVEAEGGPGSFGCFIPISAFKSKSQFEEVEEESSTSKLLFSFNDQPETSLDSCSKTQSKLLEAQEEDLMTMSFSSLGEFVFEGAAAAAEEEEFDTSRFPFVFNFEPNLNHNEILEQSLLLSGSGAVLHQGNCCNLYQGGFYFNDECSSQQQQDLEDLPLDSQDPCLLDFDIQQWLIETCEAQEIPNSPVPLSPGSCSLSSSQTNLPSPSPSPSSPSSSSSPSSPLSREHQNEDHNRTSWEITQK